MSEKARAKALAVGPENWAAVVMNYDPDPHKWGAPKSEPSRFKALATHILRAFDRPPPDIAKERASAAVGAMNSTTREFLRGELGYRDGIVNELLDVPDFQRHYAAFLHWAPQAKTSPQPSPTMSSLPRDPMIVRLASDTDELLAQIRVNQARATIDVTTPPHKRHQDLFWFVYDPLFPAEIASAITGQFESETAIMIARHATTWSSENILKLVEIRAEGVRKFARFIAGIEGSTVTAIPSDERLDVPEILRRAQRATANFAERLAEIHLK